jgi:hypothetical protein
MLIQISMQSTLLREGRYAPNSKRTSTKCWRPAAARQMSDAVWSIDSRYDSAASLLNRLRDHAHDVLPPANVELDIRADASIVTATLPLASRQAQSHQADISEAGS